MHAVSHLDFYSLNTDFETVNTKVHKQYHKSRLFRRKRWRIDRWRRPSLKCICIHLNCVQHWQSGFQTHYFVLLVFTGYSGHLSGRSKRIQPMAKNCFVNTVNNWMQQRIACWWLFFFSPGCFCLVQRWSVPCRRSAAWSCRWRESCCSSRKTTPCWTVTTSRRSTKWTRCRHKKRNSLKRWSDAGTISRSNQW